MKIIVKHKGSYVEIENDHKYQHYTDVKHFILNVIETTIDKLNKDLNYEI